MKISAITILLLNIFIVNAVSAEIDSRSYTEGKVTIEIINFNKNNKEKSEIKKLLRCGKCPGIDGFLPTTDAQRIWFTVNGKKAEIPKNLITGLYNLHIGNKFIKKTFKITSDNNILKITLSGGDGSASYDVKYQINIKTNKIKRQLFQYPNRTKPKITTGEVKYVN